MGMEPYYRGPLGERFFPLLLVNVPDPMGDGNRQETGPKVSGGSLRSRGTSVHLPGTCCSPGRLWIGFRARIWVAVG